MNFWFVVKVVFSDGEGSSGVHHGRRARLCHGVGVAGMCAHEIRSPAVIAGEEDANAVPGQLRAAEILPADITEMFHLGLSVESSQRIERELGRNEQIVALSFEAEHYFRLYTRQAVPR